MLLTRRLEIHPKSTTQVISLGSDTSIEFAIKQEHILGERYTINKESILLRIHREGNVGPLSVMKSFYPPLAIRLRLKASSHIGLSAGLHIQQYLVGHRMIAGNLILTTLQSAKRSLELPIHSPVDQIHKTYQHLFANVERKTLDSGAALAINIRGYEVPKRCPCLVWLTTPHPGHLK